MYYLTKEQLLDLHDELMELSGESKSILNESNLDTGIDAPQQRFYGQEIHETIEEKAAELMCKLCKFHPFVAGNKRTSVQACEIFLDINGYKLNASDDELFEETKSIAKCDKDTDDVVPFLKSRITRDLDNI